MDSEQLPLLQELHGIVQEKVPDEDYQQQVDRWNRYQEALFKVQSQCEALNLRFRRRINSSYRQRRLTNIKYGMAVGLFAASLVALVSILTVGPSWFTIASAGLIFTYITIASSGIMVNAGKLPEKIKFSVKASIRYDEQFYVQRFIRGMNRERRDPVIELPELTMEIPYTWLKQQALLKIMGAMKEVKL